MLRRTTASALDAMAQQDSLDAPVAIVHSLADARLALAVAARLKRRIFIASAAAAGAYAGPLWFRALAAAAEEAGDSLAGAVLDCGPYAGPVMEALQLGLPLVRFTGPAATAAKLRALAAARGARLIEGELEAFDCRHRARLEEDLEAWLLSRA